MDSEQAQDSGDFHQYLTFHSAGEAYAIPILQVKEIIPFSGATKVPLAPKVIRGLINLRGNPVAVVDLGVRFGARPTEQTKRTCVVIVDVDAGDENSVMGILTDSVSEVIELRTDDVDEAPAFGTGVSADFVDGLAKVSGNFIPIINVESVLAPGHALAAALPDLDWTADVSDEEKAEPPELAEEEEVRADETESESDEASES